MEDRKFSIKKDKDNLIDIIARSKSIKRRGKFLHNTWMGSLTISEAKDLIQKLTEAL